MQNIVDGDAPKAPSDFSTEFADFISQCLQKDPKLRKTATELLVPSSTRPHSVQLPLAQEHPWILKSHELSQQEVHRFLLPTCPTHIRIGCCPFLVGTAANRFRLRSAGFDSYRGHSRGSKQC